MLKDSQLTFKMHDKKYINWKNWREDSFGLVKPGAYFYFDQIFQPRLELKRKILEVGFGNGELMGYFRAYGHDIFGVESNELLVRRANNSGYVAYAGELGQISELGKYKFDLIVAFDVAEHMNFEQLNNFFSWVSNHLNEGGNLYLRFPEGASPFGLANQNGDFTHVTNLTMAKIIALCDTNNMDLISYFDEFLSSNKLCTLGWPGKIILLLLQAYAKIVKWVLWILLAPLATSLRLGTNSIAVMVKRNVS
jgi:2-polyprenyl-3-methyl-5-hydroxy-6-metoxy-1,4-benzoquinol methylase